MITKKSIIEKLKYAIHIDSESDVDFQYKAFFDYMDVKKIINDPTKIYVNELYSNYKKVAGLKKDKSNLLHWDKRDGIKLEKAVKEELIK